MDIIERGIRDQYINEMIQGHPQEDFLRTLMKGTWAKCRETYVEAARLSRIERKFEDTHGPRFI